MREVPSSWEHDVAPPDPARQLAYPQVGLRDICNCKITMDTCGVHGTHVEPCLCFYHAGLHLRRLVYSVCARDATVPSQSRKVARLAPRETFTVRKAGARRRHLRRVLRSIARASLPHQVDFVFHPLDINIYFCN